MLMTMSCGWEIRTSLKVISSSKVEVARNKSGRSFAHFYTGPEIPPRGCVCLLVLPQFWNTFARFPHIPTSSETGPLNVLQLCFGTFLMGIMVVMIFPLLLRLVFQFCLNFGRFFLGILVTIRDWCSECALWKIHFGKIHFSKKHFAKIHFKIRYSHLI